MISSIFDIRVGSGAFLQIFWRRISQLHKERFGAFYGVDVSEKGVTEVAWSADNRSWRDFLAVAKNERNFHAFMA